MSTENIQLLPEFDSLSYEDERDAVSELNYIDYIEQVLATEEDLS